MTDPDGTYTWHPDGTLDTYTPNSGPVEDYTYDAAGRLTDITNGTTSTGYSYDALDRIAQRNSAAFTYAGGSLDPTSDGTDSYHRTVAGGLLAVGTATGTYSAAVNNHLNPVNTRPPSRLATARLRSLLILAATSSNTPGVSCSSTAQHLNAPSDGT